MPIAATSTPTQTQAITARANAEAVQQPSHEGGGLSAKLVSIGFWSTFASLIVGAAASAGVMLLFLLPLVGIGYLIFCLIASTNDRDVE